MQHSLALSVCAVSMIYAAGASADHLKGTYGFTGSSACLHASGGFNAKQQAQGTVWFSSSSDEGIRTFNGDGTGTFTNRDTSVTAPPTPPTAFPASAGSSEGGASFTYAVKDDTFTLQNVPGTDKGTILTGPRAGQTFTLEGVPPATGLISANGHTLTTSILTPGVETITFFTSTGPQVEHRICHRSRVLIKLDNDGAQ